MQPGRWGHEGRLGLAESTCVLELPPRRGPPGAQVPLSTGTAASLAKSGQPQAAPAFLALTARPEVASLGFSANRDLLSPTGRRLGVLNDLGVGVWRSGVVPGGFC